MATNRGLWWPDEPARLIDWHSITKAVWSEAGLTVFEADVDDFILVDRRPIRVALSEPRKVPEVVRQRVEASIVYNFEIVLPEGPANLVARKIIGQNGLSWWARLGPHTPDNSSTRLALGQLLAERRDENEARLRSL